LALIRTPVLGPRLPPLPTGIPEEMGLWPQNSHRTAYENKADITHLILALVLVHADTSVHPDLLNSRFGYVSISRASHVAEINTNDTTGLGQKLNSDVSKSFAVEFSPSTDSTMLDLSLGQGI